ncbi:YheC/YheD family endospore coat-associated protein [Halalkalibacterium ligniniphilum]|uniref:YheC/YheD family endospore coat-associated protein n=1 Tax=Halalkalibacterium ligniniphilum TaxID=1134413 RepID=UPI00034A930B|nr:YheC/YheD family protein [Halalkalibacterium ligniniphilum]
MILNYPLILTKTTKLTYDGPTLFIPRKLFRHWQLQTGIVYPIKLGPHTVATFIQPHDEKSTFGFGNASLYHMFSLPDTPTSLRLFNDGNNFFQLGPVMAVLTHDPKATQGGLALFFQELCQFAQKNGCLCYIIHTDDWKDHALIGKIKTETDWVSTIVPLPDVVYNRIGTRPKEKEEQALSIYKTCKKLRIPYFNDHFFDKATCYNVLKEKADVFPHLPETTTDLSEEAFASLLRSYQTVYLKPIDGTEGKGIFCFTEEENRITIKRTDGSLSRNHTLQSLLRTLEPLFKKRPYLLQQGISLRTLDQCTVDFRFVTMKKIKQNDWSVASSIARLSAPERLVTNLAQGGTSLKVEKVLAHWYTEKEIATLIKQMTILCTKISRYLEHKLYGWFVEFGIDLGVDQNGHLWLIEVNAKPSKNQDFIPPPGTFRPTVRKLVQLFYEICTLSHRS